MHRRTKTLFFNLNFNLIISEVQSMWHISLGHWFFFFSLKINELAFWCVIKFIKLPDLSAKNTKKTNKESLYLSRFIGYIKIQLKSIKTSNINFYKFQIIFFFFLRISEPFRYIKIKRKVQIGTQGTYYVLCAQIKATINICRIFSLLNRHITLKHGCHDTQRT